MPNYQNAKIYKIINDELPNLIYIGSTVQPLINRLCEHRKNAKNAKINLTSKQLFEIGKPKIILLENFSCDSKEELFKRERYYIESIQCVNKNIPTRTSKEYYQDNKELMIQKSINYYNNHAYDISIKRKVLVTCECGVKITKACLLNHRKSIKHKEIIQIKNQTFKKKIQEQINNFLDELTFDNF